MRRFTKAAFGKLTGLSVGCADLSPLAAESGATCTMTTPQFEQNRASDKLSELQIGQILIIAA
jgi:hypothetical protein